jgi:hypothetical protein
MEGDMTISWNTARRHKGGVLASLLIMTSLVPLASDALAQSGQAQPRAQQLKPLQQKLPQLAPPANTAGVGRVTAQKPAPVTVKKHQGYPYYTMKGFYQSLCMEPPERVFKGCKKVSTMQAAAAASFLIYYGHMIGNDSVVVVIPRSKLGALAGPDMSAKLIEMTHRFGSEKRTAKK